MDRTHSFGYWLRRRRKALDPTKINAAQGVRANRVFAHARGQCNQCAASPAITRIALRFDG